MVSIHAPTRGATFRALRDIAKDKVSIHAPTRGATQLLRDKRQQEAFQSTHPHGVRHTFLFCTQNPKGFNPRTHTGCDRIMLITWLVKASFNPRTHTGCDKSAFLICCALTPFQSTHPHGVRRFSCFARHRKRQGFNPRTHTGCDQKKEIKSTEKRVSIHAPTRGATSSVIVMIASKPCFNPRTHTGCDTQNQQKFLRLYAFQSTHPHGVRPK